MRKKKILNLNTIILFGIYKGDTIQEIIERDPHYMEFVLYNTRDRVADEVIYYLREYINYP